MGGRPGAEIWGHLWNLQSISGLKAQIERLAESASRGVSHPHSGAPMDASTINHLAVFAAALSLMGLIIGAWR